MKKIIYFVILLVGCSKTPTTTTGTTPNVIFKSNGSNIVVQSAGWHVFYYLSKPYIKIYVGNGTSRNTSGSENIEILWDRKDTSFVRDYNQNFSTYVSSVYDTINVPVVSTINGKKDTTYKKEVHFINSVYVIKPTFTFNSDSSININYTQRVYEHPGVTSPFKSNRNKFKDVSLIGVVPKN